MNVVNAFLVRPITIGRGFAMLARSLAVAAGLVLSACGGSADAPPPPEGGPAPCVAASITTQPAGTSVTAGQSATFTVVAAGTAPLTYQWQRNGVDIEGATAATYTLSTTPLDSGVVFRAAVTNCAGSVTSNGATLTVATSGPVLTITPQPANASVATGAQASFAVGGTCSSGTLDIQWQRNSGTEGAFVDIAGATAATYSFMTVLADSGAQFRALLDCSGQSATTSSAATLTVSAPGSVTLSLLPINGLRPQADISAATAIDQLSDGSYVFASQNRLKKLSADLLTITPFAGTTTSGSTDGDALTSALFNTPFGLTHDAAGVVYVADTRNSTIRRIAVDGTVSTLAGSPGLTGSADGTGPAARFQSPWSIAMGPDGDLYVADNQGATIRRVTTAGVVTTYAGTGTAGFLDGLPTVAQFRSPSGIAVAANGDVIVSDSANHRMRRIVRSGNVAGSVETLAGSGATASPGADGTGAAAGIVFPTNVYVRGNNAYVRTEDGLVRQIDLTTRAVTTFTGSRTLGEGYADGAPGEARLRDLGVGITGGVSGGLVIAEDFAVRSIDAAGNVTTIAKEGVFDQTLAGVGVLKQLEFGLAINDFYALAVDSAGAVIVTDGDIVRKIAPDGTVSLVAGLSGSFGGVVDGVGKAAQFADLGPSMARAPDGTLYVWNQYVVRRIGTDNSVTTLAGSTTNFGAVDGNGGAARFNRGFGMTVGASGDVFVGDAGNCAVRRVDSANNVTSIGVFGQCSRVDGPIATARFMSPSQMTTGPDGSIYVADAGSVRKISADGTMVSTLSAAGGSVATVAAAADGTLYFVDNGGLSMLAPGAPAATSIVHANGGANVLGSVNPSLFGVQALTVLGPKQILVLSDSQLVVVTLP